MEELQIVVVESAESSAQLAPSVHIKRMFVLELWRRILQIIFLTCDLPLVANFAGIWCSRVCQPRIETWRASYHLQGSGTCRDFYVRCLFLASTFASNTLTGVIRLPQLLKDGTSKSCTFCSM